MMRYKRLPHYLRTYRKKAGLSQKEASYLLGKTGSSYLSRLELSQREVPLKVAMALSVIYGVSITELFAGTHATVEEAVRERRERMKPRED